MILLHPCVCVPFCFAVLRKAFADVQRLNNRDCIKQQKTLTNWPQCLVEYLSVQIARRLIELGDLRC